MSLKFKYILFISALHLVLITLIYFLLKEKLWYFLASEIGVFISIFFSYLLYKSFIRPIDMIQSGTDAIADKDFSVKYVKTGSSEVDKLVGVYNKMIDTLRSERIKISEQSFFIQKLIEVSPLGIIILDYDGLISNINYAAKIHLDFGKDKEVIGKPLQEFDGELITVLNEFRSGHSEIIRTLNQGKYKVQVNEVVHQGFKRRFILIDDLSKEMLKTEKEAYGRVIRMMAHEVNNSMGAINSILDSVIEFGFDDQADMELKQSLEIARTRNVSLSKFMDNYASLLRLPSPVMEKVDLARLLKKTGQLFFHSAQERGVNIVLDVPNHNVTIEADSVLLEQAISNIIKNAIEAIEDTGEIRISCRQQPLGFVISDNGIGLSDEVAKNIFTPFYSTKTTGQGVGLMLVRDVLKSHEATFNLSTDLKGWTNFEVLF